MCNPVLLVSIATSVAAHRQRQKNSRAAQDNFDLNAQVAGEARTRNLTALDSRLDQERRATGDKIADVRARAAETEGFNFAAAASANIGGEALFAVLQDGERRALEKVGSLKQNLAATTEQISREKDAVVDRQFASILGQPQGAKNSVLVPFLEVAGAFAKSYADGDFDTVDEGDSSNEDNVNE